MTVAAATVALAAALGGGPEELVQAAPPPFSDGIFPCSQCHDGSEDRTRRDGTHFQELSPERLAARLRRLEEEHSRRSGKEVHVRATPAREGACSS